MEEAGINTIVVKALMSLRGMSVATLASVLQVRSLDLVQWLERDEPTLPAHRQMEVLDMLGVRGDSLRGDVVHYWRVTEPIFGRAEKVYTALHILTEAFGKAQVVYLARESDPSFSLNAKAHFGLKFPGFYAVLEVQGSPLVNLKFTPEVSPGLDWMEGSVGLLMESDRYLSLEPGAIQPEELGEQVEVVQNLLKWEQLSELAKTAKVSPDQLAAVVEKVARNQLGFTAAEPAAAEVAAPTQAAAQQQAQAPEQAVHQRPAPASPNAAVTVPPVVPARSGSFSYVD